MIGEDDYLDTFMEDRLSGRNGYSPDPEEELMYEKELFDGIDERSEEEEEDFEEDEETEPKDQFLSDAEADADVLTSIGWGMDEDYGYFGDFD